MSTGDDAFSARFHRKREKEERLRKQLPTDDDPALPAPVEPIHGEAARPGRNDPCSCGSGKKYKQCCLKKDQK